MTYLALQRACTVKAQSLSILGLMLFSSMPAIANNFYGVGDSLDRLSGERMASCLAMDDVDLRERYVNETETSFFLASTRTELAEKLGIKINAEVSANYGSFSSRLTSATDVLKTSKFSETALVGVYRFRYKFKEYQTSFDRLELSSVTKTLLQDDNKAFRLSCGDGYTNSMIFGSELYIVFNLRHKQNHNLNQVHTKNAVEAAFGSFFKTSVETSVEKERQKLLNNLEISVDCVAVGLPMESCVLPNGSIQDKAELATITDFISRANEQLLKVEDGDYVDIAFEFQAYDPPSDITDVPYNKVFFDITDYENKVLSLINAEQKVEKHCAQKGSYQPCENARRELGRQISDCAQQPRWASCKVNLGFLESLPEIEVYNPGKVTMVADRKDGYIPQNTRKIVLDFNNTYKFPGEKGFLEYDRLYSLADFNFPYNIATAYFSELKPGYRLCVYTDYSQRDFWEIGSFDNRWHNFTWMNDDADYFRLVKVGEYASGC